MRPTDDGLLLLLLGLVVGVCKCVQMCASVAPGGRSCLGQPLRPWPLVGLHLVKDAATEVVATEVVATEVVATEVVATEVVATEVVATEVVRASVTVAMVARATAVRATAVPATEVVRAVAEARAAASRGNASMDVGRRRRSLDPDRDSYRDHVNSGL